MSARFDRGPGAVGKGPWPTGVGSFGPFSVLTAAGTAAGESASRTVSRPSFYGKPAVFLRRASPSPTARYDSLLHLR